MGENYLEVDAWVPGELRLGVLPVTRPFRVPCMVPAAYGSVLHRPYRRVRQCCWYHSVDWHEATSVAEDVLRRALTQPTARDGSRPGLSATVAAHLSPRCPQRLRQAVESLAWQQPIMACPQRITHGVHRLTAMRHQGVKSTPALILARVGQHVAEEPGVYPHPHLN
ncbi:hypothetical protein ACFYE2_14995 [Kocuria sp. CPCC 205300]|uniref:hypothetical protein n=1 Tax=Kocuria sabuli TaxID=3071448 RepID=UPI0036DF036A